MNHASANQDISAAAVANVKMTTKYKELGCEFKNESECQEAADEEGSNIDELEKEEFDDEKEELVEKCL